jgi:hypothetical protein
LHVEPALQSCVHPPAVQSKLQFAPLSQVCVQSVADVLQSPLQRLSSLQAMSQLATVHVCVQSSFALHAQRSVALQPIVRVVRDGFGTSVSPPPPSLPVDPLELAPPELDDDPVDSSSDDDLQATTTTSAAETSASVTSDRRRG